MAKMAKMAIYLWGRAVNQSLDSNTAVPNTRSSMVKHHTAIGC